MANKFKDELIDLWTDFYNTDKIYDVVFVSDDLIEVKCENKKVANEFADYIMAKYNAPICYDFRKGNDCYQFSISPSLMIRESKKNLKESDENDFYESKKSVRKSLKKYLVKGLDVDFVVDHLLSLEDSDNFDLINKLGDLWEVYNKSWDKFNNFLSDFWKVMKDIKKLNSFDKTCKEIIDAWYDDIEKIFYSDDNLENFKLNYGFKGNDIFEIKESAKKSLKESTDESFSLYDLNKHDPFVKEWIRNINKELKDVSIESIGDDEIVFRVWFDENIDLDTFDDTATDCMPSLLIEFMSDMNIDFNYQFVYADDKFTENDYVFIRFVAW